MKLLILPWKIEAIISTLMPDLTFDGLTRKFWQVADNDEHEKSKKKSCEMI